MSAAEEVKKDAAVGEAEHVKPATEARVAEATNTTKTEVVPDVPDPEDDDLDDLDDMLDDFSAAKISAQKPAETVQPAVTKPASSNATKDAHPSAQDDFPEEDFAKQLQAGMAELLGELDKSPDMQTQFEEMFKQMSAASGGDGGAEEPPKTQPESTAPKANASKGGEASFQETIRKTMERMQTSGDQATAAASSSTEDDFMAELLKQMTSGDLGGEGNEEEFSKMLMGMMEQLTNKEILYEPMKELHDKFPDWLEKNRANTPAEDLKRYDEQQGLVKEIVGKFEEPTYADSNAKDREYIVERMQKMQAAGSPPSDLVGDMASAQEAFAGPEDQCNPQ